MLSLPSPACPRCANPWRMSALHCIAASGLTIATTMQCHEVARQTQALTAGGLPTSCSQQMQRRNYQQYDEGEKVMATTRCSHAFAKLHGQLVPYQPGLNNCCR